MDFSNVKITDRLLQHELVIQTLEDRSTLFDNISKRAERENGKVDEGYKYFERAAEYYINNVSIRLNKLLDAVERLHQIPFYIRIFPNTNLFEKKDITKHKWIKYHHSNFFIYMYSIYDNALLLVNDVLRIGLKERNCNNSTIKKNSNVRGTKIYESLSDLDQFVENFREERNLIVHRSHQPKHERLDRYKRILYLIDSQEKFDLDFDEEQGEIFNKGPILRRLYKKEKMELADELHESNQEVISLLREFFTSLQPYYAYHTGNK